MSKAIYTARCEKAWDGDRYGNHWRCGVSVYRCESDGVVYGQTRTLFRVFEDDGAGNGDHLDSFETEADARGYADLYVQFLDAGGYADSPEGAAMCAWSQERSHYSLATGVAAVARGRDRRSASASTEAERVASATEKLCERCGGEGAEPWCPRCSDSTDDHDCGVGGPCARCNGIARVLRRARPVPSEAQPRAAKDSGEATKDPPPEGVHSGWQGGVAAVPKDEGPRSRRVEGPSGQREPRDGAPESSRPLPQAEEPFPANEAQAYWYEAGRRAGAKVGPPRADATPARLDADGTARPLTEIAAVMPAATGGEGATVHVGQAVGYVVRPTTEPRLERVPCEGRPEEERCGRCAFCVPSPAETRRIARGRGA